MDKNSADKLKKDLQKMQYEFIITIVEMIDCKEQSVSEHSHNAGKYSKVIAEELLNRGYYKGEIDEDFITKLLYSAPIHDIGKLYTPSEILNKPGRLIKEEYETMKMHTIDGAKIIKKIIEKSPDDVAFTELLDFAKDIVTYHHEKWDGTGYPYGLSKNEIPLSARVMAIADMYDAITSRRVYRDKMSEEEAVRIITEGSGKHFDPIIVSAFLSSYDRISNILKSEKESSK